MMSDDIHDDRQLLFECSVNSVTLNVSRPLEQHFFFLAPTGALIVIVVYYTTSAARPLFEISSISANIFSFSF